MNSMDEFYKALQLVDQENLKRKPIVKEYRIFYDQDGSVTMFSEFDHPEGNNYIIVDNPDLYHKANTLFLRVIDGKLITLNNKMTQQTLIKSNKGQPVVKGIAALALGLNEEYLDIEYYDQTNY